MIRFFNARVYQIDAHGQQRKADENVAECKQQIVRFTGYHIAKTCKNLTAYFFHSFLTYGRQRDKEKVERHQIVPIVLPDHLHRRTHEYPSDNNADGSGNG
jgi:hypothetical protein